VNILLFWLHIGIAATSSWSPLPPPLAPAHNPVTAPKIALGKQLFHEQGLSATGAYSCASCHQPDRYFTDGAALAVGASGQTLALNTPTLYYSAFNASQGWLDSGAQTLEQQHLTPLQATDPIEMGYRPQLLQRLLHQPEYAIAFAQAFGDQQPYDITHVVNALASYLRSLQPPMTAFDRYLFYDEALPPSARAGMALFFSERLGCSHCHASISLSGPIQHSQVQANPVFHAMGVGGSQAAFRAPTLRYIRHTAPYMHDGSMSTLASVITHYQNTPSPRVPKFKLSAQEVRQLIDFLNVL